MNGPTVFYKFDVVKGAVDVLFLPGEKLEETRILYTMSADDFLRFFFNMVIMVAAIAKNYRMVPNEAATAKAVPKMIQPEPSAPPASPLEFPDAVDAVENFLRGNKDEEGAG